MKPLAPNLLPAALASLPSRGPAPRHRLWRFPTLSKRLPAGHSISALIFGASLAMGLMTALLGGYGIHVLREAGRIVAETYDGPLMEIDFARAASLGFVQMDKEALRLAMAPGGERAEIEARIDALGKTFFEDLAVAEQRSLGTRETAIIGEIRQSVTHWNDLRRSGAVEDAETERLSDQIIQSFDTLIELTADRSFIERRQAIWAIAWFRWTSMALSAAAILVGIFLTLLLARRMVKPLTAAAAVADRIAEGHLETPIPRGGRDEIGTLLRSMTIMQDNVRDMIEREVAQRESAQSRLVDAIESSREGMVLVDAAGRIVIANSQIADFFPAIAPDIVSGADFEAAFSPLRRLLARSDEDEIPAAIRRPAADPTRSVGELQLADGRWLRFSHSATHDGGFFLFLIDVTEIKEREERFKEATRQANAANTAKSRFLANMSHELRTPLNAIIGFSEIIGGQMFGSIGNPKYLDYIDDVLRSGRHLLEIINSVLDLAKSESGKLGLRSEALDLGDIIRDCATMIRPQCKAAGLLFQLAVPEAPLPAWGDPAKLRQIMLNLLSNAVKFNTPRGSVSLVAQANVRTGMTEFGIADTGIGMSPDDVAIGLTPFGQVDGSLARRYEGTGLGLPLTKVLVELHGGTMTIDSEPGRGTLVTIGIPQGPAAAPAHP
jgi:signal transduction histidine kinase